MPFVVSLLAGFVSSTVVKALLMRATVALGFAAVTYTGVYISLNAIVAQINQNMNGGGNAVGTAVLQLLNQAHVPQGMNVVLSAYAGALALKGLTAAGAITKVGISSAPGAVFSPGTF